MATSPALTTRQHERLATIRQREEAGLRARVPSSLKLGAEAREVMPSGPMTWMSGRFRTPPLWIAEGQGAMLTDVDGNRYLDFNISDMSTALGYAHLRLTEVIAEPAARGEQFLLPVKQALTVCDQLTEWTHRHFACAILTGSELLAEVEAERTYDPMT